MLLLLFTFIAFFIICYGYGFIINPLIDINKKSISLTLFSGILFLIIVNSIVAFFFKLDVVYECLINSIGVVIGCKAIFKNFKSIKALLNYEFVFLIFLVLFIASFYPYIVDHFGYYIPSIKWLNEYGIVKGIANLSFVLGQQSPWHILQAGLDNTIDPFFKLNAYFLLFYIVYYLENKKIELLLPLPILLLYIQSPSADLAVIIFTIVLLFEGIKKDRNLAFLMLLSVLTFYIKPLAFGLVFWVLYLIFNDKKKLDLTQKYWKYSFLFSFIIVFLFLFKNYYTSGLYLFPLDLKIGSPVWIVSKDCIETSNNLALLKTYDMKYSYAEISKMGLFSKFFNWLMLSGFKGIINKLFIVIIGLYFTILIYLKEKKLILFGLISTLNLVMIYFFSAQYRFMLPLIFGFLLIIILKLNLDKTKLKIGLYSLSIALIFIVAIPNVLQSIVPSFQLSFLMRKYESKLLIQPENYASPSFKTKKIGNLSYNVPTNYPYTYSIPLPSVSIYEDEKFKNSTVIPQLINSNKISEGFYTKINK